jgi:hypothetical protein
MLASISFNFYVALLGNTPQKHPAVQPCSPKQRLGGEVEELQRTRGLVLLQDRLHFGIFPILEWSMSSGPG